MELNTSLNVDLFQNFLGVIFESENDANGIQKILQELHGYVPYVGDGEEQEYASQAIVGDQLTIERAVNAHMTLSNGFTLEERLDGIHCEIADWHGGNKAIGVRIFIYCLHYCWHYIYISVVVLCIV